MALEKQTLLLKVIHAVEEPFQLRVHTNAVKVAELAERMAPDGEGFSATHPLTIYRHEDKWVLVDGFHRYSAAKKAGLTEAPCEVFEGSLTDALSYGILMNRDHGQNLETQDFKKAAKVLHDRGMNPNQIAKALWPGVVVISRADGGNGTHPKKGMIAEWVGTPSGVRAHARTNLRATIGIPIIKAFRAANPDVDILSVTSQELERGGLIARGWTPPGEDAAPPAAAEPAGPDPKAVRAQQEIVRLKAEVRALAREADTAERIREQIFGLAAHTPDPPTWLQSEHVAGAPGVPMTIWSDWHWGEKVFRNQVGGVNEFNSIIAAERAKLLVTETVKLLKTYTVNPVYPGVVVCLGGDMITGDIHPELEATNDATVQQSIVGVTDALLAGLRQMGDAFGRVFVSCVPGNHGRDTLKPRMKNRVHTSHEWLVYQMLERFLKDDPRIQFQIPDETDAYFSVYGHRFLLTHGDTLGVKGGDGIIGALGPIARGTMKVGRSEAQIGRDFDTLVIGHWHTYIPRGEAVHVIVNGALKGYDEYARLALRVPYSRPSQALWFVHPLHGVTNQWQIYLDEPRKSSGSADWVSFEQRRAA
jgi:predicted phosphodiesterase